MVRTCQQLCKRYYKEIIRESLTGILKKSRWKRCYKCEIFIKIEAWLCPCCHDILRKMKNLAEYLVHKAWYQKNKQHCLDYQKAYHLKNRDKILQQQKERRIRKKQT